MRRVLLVFVPLVVGACAAPAARPVPTLAPTPNIAATVNAQVEATVSSQALVSRTAVVATAVAAAATANAAIKPAPTIAVPTSTPAPQPTPTTEPTLIPELTALPKPTVAVEVVFRDQVPTKSPFTASVNGTSGTRFELFCFSVQWDGSSSSQSWRGVAPESHSLTPAARVSCSAQKVLAGRNQTLILQIISGGTVLKTSETTSPFGVVEAATGE